jgi:hypothetical protein
MIRSLLLALTLGTSAAATVGGTPWDLKVFTNVTDMVLRGSPQQINKLVVTMGQIIPGDGLGSFYLSTPTVSTNATNLIFSGTAGYVWQKIDLGSFRTNYSLSQYYGTDSAGNFGYFSLPVAAGLVTFNSDQIVTDSGGAKAIKPGALLTNTVLKGSSTITATGASVSRYLEDRLGEVMNVLDKGASGDGVTDNTAAIQAALTSGVGKTVVFPYIAGASNKYVCGEVTFPSGNIRVLLEPGVVIQSDVTLLTGNKRLFNITGTGDVTVSGYGATIQMVKAGFSGEHNHALFFYGGTGKYLVEGVTIQDTGGDGIYMGASNGHIAIRDVISRRNRRNGYSIIACGSSHAYNSRFSEQTGTAPSDGIDIEPDLLAERLGLITFNGCQFSDNDGSGAMVFLGNWNASTNYARIQFLSCVSTNNGKASVGGNKESGFDVRRVKDVGSSPGRGEVLFQNCVSINDNNSAFRIRDVSSGGVKTKIIDALVINCNRANLSFSDQSPFTISSTGIDYTTMPGNVDIIRPLIIDDGTLDSNVVSAITVFSPDTNSVPQKIYIEEPRFIGVTDRQFFSDHSKDILVVNQTPELVSLTTDENVTVRNSGEELSNDSATVDITLTMRPAAEAGTNEIYRFVVTSQHELKVQAAPGDTIVYDGRTASHLTSSFVGSRITLRKKSSSTWAVTSSHGTWGADEAGGGYGAIMTKAVNYTATVRDSVVLVDTSSGAVTITLPDPATVRGKRFSVKKITGDGNQLTVNVSGGSNIDTSSSKTTIFSNDGWELESNGAQYYAVTAHRASRTITGDSEIVVSNGNGEAGNPLLSIGSSIARDSEVTAAVATKQDSDSDLTAIAGLTGTGVLVRTGTGTATVRTITGDSEIVVSNGSGVSGNPTLSIASTIARDLEVTAAVSGKVDTSRTISTTAPLAGGGDLSANRTLSISQSGSASDGYLSSTDWNAFNSKVSSSRSITGAKSITGGGDLSSDRTVEFVNDSTSPGANKVYGTDASGVKGWKNDPAGGGGLSTRTGVVREQWFPANVMTGGATTPAAIGTFTYGGATIVPTLDFDASGVETAHWVWSAPEAWDLGAIKLKVYWTAATGTASEGVVWAASIFAFSDGDTPSTSSPYNSFSADAYQGAGVVHISPALSISPSTPAAGDWLGFSIARQGSNASDTKTGDAQLIGVKIQYTESTTEPSAW